MTDACPPRSFSCEAPGSGGLPTARLRETLAAHGIRLTRQREEVYTALAASHAHPTAEELLRTVRLTQPGISLATVYNTLETFTRAGLCRKVSVAAGGGACRYDADLSDHLHVITADGRVHDVPEDLGREVLAQFPPDVVRRIGERMGVSIGRVSVDFLAGGAGGGPGAGGQGGGGQGGGEGGSQTGR